MNDLSPVALIFVIIVAIWLLNAIKILREYERGVIFRLGRLLPEAKGPGLIDAERTLSRQPKPRPSKTCNTLVAPI